MGAAAVAGNCCRLPLGSTARTGYALPASPQESIEKGWGGGTGLSFTTPLENLQKASKVSSEERHALASSSSSNDVGCSKSFK